MLRMVGAAAAAAALAVGVPSALAVTVPAIARYAGTGATGAVVPGPATSSPIWGPTAMVTDPLGNLYVTLEGTSQVVRITPAGTVSVVAGSGSAAMPQPGPATSSPLWLPSGLVFDSAGNLYISVVRYILKVTPGGTLSIFAGDGNLGPVVPGAATSTPVGLPMGMVVDGSDNVYAVESLTRRIIRITPGGTLSIIAGTGATGSYVPGPALSSPMRAPTYLVRDGAGNLYVTDYGDDVIVKITPGGALSIFAGSGGSGAVVPGPALGSPLVAPYGIAIDSAGTLFVVLTGTSQIVQITAAGTLSVAVGNGNMGTMVPGPATGTPLDVPIGVAVGPGPTLYVSEYQANAVDRIAVAAAGGGAGGLADTGPATTTLVPAGLLLVLLGAVAVWLSRWRAVRR